MPSEDLMISSNLAKPSLEIIKKGRELTRPGGTSLLTVTWEAESVTKNYFNLIVFVQPINVVPVKSRFSGLAISVNC